MKELSEVEKSWLACFIDTDGGIHIEHRECRDHTPSHKWVQIRIYFVNTDRNLIEQASKLTEKPVRVMTHFEGQHYGSKPVFRVVVTKNSEVEFLLSQVIPYLIAKRDKAIEAMKNVKVRRRL